MHTQTIEIWSLNRKIAPVLNDAVSSLMSAAREERYEQVASALYKGATLLPDLHALAAAAEYLSQLQVTHKRVAWKLLHVTSDFLLDRLEALSEPEAAAVAGQIHHGFQTAPGRVLTKDAMIEGVLGNGPRPWSGQALREAVAVVHSAKGLAELAIDLEAAWLELPPKDHEAALAVLEELSRWRHWPLADPLNTHIFDRAYQQSLFSIMGMKSPQFWQAIAPVGARDELEQFLAAVLRMKEQGLLPVPQGSRYSILLTDFLLQRPSKDDQTSDSGCVPLKLLADHMMTSEGTQTLTYPGHMNGFLAGPRLVYDLSTSGIEFSPLEIWRRTGHFGKGQEPESPIATLSGILLNLGIMTGLRRIRTKTQSTLLFAQSYALLPDPTTALILSFGHLDTPDKALYWLEEAEQRNPTHPSLALVKSFLYDSRYAGLPPRQRLQMAIFELNLGVARGSFYEKRRQQLEPNAPYPLFQGDKLLALRERAVALGKKLTG